MKIEPRGDTVIIKPIARPTTTKSGLFLVDIPEDRLDEGHVVAMGPGRRLANGQRRQADVKVGDRVMYMPLLLIQKNTPVGTGMKISPEYDDCVLVPGRAIVLVFEETYDPAMCVTAGELREKGVQIPLEIPDPAWVPKDKVRYAVHDAVTTYDKAAGRIESAIPVHIDAEFKWIEVAIEETKKEISVVSSECSAAVGEKKS